MNKYKLTSVGEEVLFDRTRILAGARISYSSQDYYYDEPLDFDIPIQEDNIVDCEFVKLHNKLLFIFDTPEDVFTINFQSLVIGFKEDYSRGLAEGLEKLIYINADNLYAGITDQGIEDEDITLRRLKGAQLQYGKNCIIIPNIFPCRFIYERVIENDLTVNSLDQLKEIYPYYEKV